MCHPCRPGPGFFEAGLRRAPAPQREPSTPVTVVQTYPDVSSGRYHAVGPATLAPRSGLNDLITLQN
jgi:hypothetical protein